MGPGLSQSLDLLNDIIEQQGLKDKSHNLLSSHACFSFFLFDRKFLTFIESTDLMLVIYKEWSF